MADTFTQGGVIYRDNGDGTVTPIGYEETPIAPQDPRIGPAAQNTQVDASVNAATAGAQISKAQADAAKAQADATMAQVEASKANASRPALTATEFADAISGYRSADSLTGIIQDLKKKYDQGPGATQGWRGLSDFFDTPANQTFDKAGDAARGIVGKALGFTGTQLNSVAEAQMNVGAYIPQSSQWDSTIESTIARLEELQRDAYLRAVTQLGGVPDMNGNITPIDKVPAERLPEPLRAQREGRERSAFEVARQMAEDPLIAAAMGSNKGTKPIPPEMQQEHSNFISQGNFTPEQYAQFRAGLDEKYGFPLPGPYKMREYEQVAPEILKVLKQGGDIGQIPPAERVLTPAEQMRNSAVNNPVGGLATGFANMMSIGGVEGLAGDQYGALRESQGTPVLLGEILGAVAGTEGLGAIGRNTIGRAAPSLLGGGGRAQMARNLGTDTLFGAGYGGVTEGDPLSGAGYSALGSVGGQYVGKGVGAGIRGAAASGPARTLKDAGVRLTGGQLIGGPMKALEDRMMSVPILGDIVRNRRVEGMEDFNRAAFNEAGQPIGASVASTGRDGLEQLNMAVTQAYDDATRGVNVQLDPQFKSDMAKVAQARDTLPPDYAARFDKVGENRIGPIVNAGEMSGETYQQSMRGLKGSKASASGAAPGFEQEYKDALSQAMDVLDAQMQRGGGSQVVEGLGKANETYKRFKTLKDAMDRGIGGTQSGEVGLFTPNQLQQAGKATERKFGDRPFSELADAGQSVLPSQIPDSGTAGRLAQLALPGALAGGGGLGYAASGDVGGATTGAGATLTLGAMLSLMATKQGQAAVRAILSNRNDATRRAGQIVGERSGLLGHAAIPLVN